MQVRKGRLIFKNKRIKKKRKTKETHQPKEGHNLPTKINQKDLNKTQSSENKYDELSTNFERLWKNKTKSEVKFLKRKKTKLVEKIKKDIHKTHR